MAIKRIATAVLLAFVSIMVFSGVSSSSSSEHSRVHVQAHSEDMLWKAEAYADYVQVLQMNDIVNYVQSEEIRQIVDLVSANEAAEAAAAAAAQAALEAAQRAAASHAVQAPRATYSAPAAPAPSGGACGGATNGADQYINRESGGNPYITNGGGTAADPYSAGRAWGCYQIMPDTWAGACGVHNQLGLPPITTYDPASQAQCASRLGLSAWASSGPTG